MAPNSFECHENSENIENQEDQIFLDVKRCKPTFSCRTPPAKEAVNTNLKPLNGQNAIIALAGHLGKQRSALGK